MTLASPEAVPPIVAFDASTSMPSVVFGTAAVPAYQGADPSQAGQSKALNMNDTPILQFAGNSVYGATSSGMTVWWIGTFGDNFYSDARVSVVKDLTAWHIGTRAFYGYPTNNLTIDGLVVRGDASFASNGYNYAETVAPHLPTLP